MWTFGVNKTGLKAKISIKYVLPTCIWKYFWRISRYFAVFWEFRRISRKYLNFVGPRPREYQKPCLIIFLQLKTEHTYIFPQLLQCVYGRLSFLWIKYITFTPELLLTIKTFFLSAEAAVPPWVGYNEEETMKNQILALSTDERNFLRDPPAGVPFHFDSDSMYPVALATLQEDKNLTKMRFQLVPKK